VDLNELDTLLCGYNKKAQYGNKQIRLVAVSGASNVLGGCNNLDEISRITHKYGARLLVDAAQLVAHRKVDMEQCGIDYFAFSAHKVYAPFGTGALVARQGLLYFNPAELELIKSSGEENSGGIAALGKALIILQRIGMDLIQKEEQNLTAYALKSLAKIARIRMYGIKNPDSSRFSQKGGVIVFDLKNILPSLVARKLAEQGGIGVRYGCHCAHLLIKRLVRVPPVLEQIQGLIVILFPKLILPGLVRVSLGIENNKEDIDTLVCVLNKIARQNRTKADSKSVSKHNDATIIRQPGIKDQINDFVKDASQRVYSQLQ